VNPGSTLVMAIDSVRVKGLNSRRLTSQLHRREPRRDEVRTWSTVEQRFTSGASVSRRRGSTQVPDASVFDTAVAAVRAGPRHIHSSFRANRELAASSTSEQHELQRSKTEEPGRRCDEPPRRALDSQV
jgi:hypothetical protein